MAKVLMLGAGSAFTSRLAIDIMNIPELDGGIFALVDIDEERLVLSHRLIEQLNQRMDKKWKVISSTDRREVMAGSDYLINSIEVSGLATVKYDYEIPLKYGVDQCIGDTIGPGGVFKALRTIPVWVEILEDAEELCPDALIMNYTNPMSMMMLAAAYTTDMPAVGLCHSVQGTSKQLAGYLGIPYEELNWKCGGINHMAWFTQLTHNGQDMYPLLKEKAGEKDIYERDPVRFETMLQLGAFVTESSGHFSEYVPYFRKRKDIIDKYCRKGYLGESGFYANNWPLWRKQRDINIEAWISGEKELSMNRSHEYGSVIMEAHLTGKPAVIYGTVPNLGLIENLSWDGVVEVPVMVDKKGYHPCRFGALPPQLAALNMSNMAVYELTVKAALEKDKEAAIHALMLDPLTSAVCSLEEIRKMGMELFEAEKEYLPDFD
jgi:alpha-galactosidase